MTWELDPYATLEVETTAAPVEIKRAYKRLSLKWHPDKNKLAPKDAFAKVQFAYQILSCPERRKRYDATGLLSEQSEDVDWVDYFNLMATKVLIHMIEEDRARYVASDEERQDILDNFVFYDGDFLKLFEVIPHLEFTEELEQRVFTILESTIDELGLTKEVMAQWVKYRKSRKTKVKQMLKKLAKEAKEAEKAKKAMGDCDLQALIRRRHQARSLDFMDMMEAKYGGSTKRGKKRSEPSEEDFDRMAKKKRLHSSM